jgi:hypothetical protein
VLVLAGETVVEAKGEVRAASLYHLMVVVPTSQVAFKVVFSPTQILAGLELTPVAAKGIGVTVTLVELPGPLHAGFISL